MTASVIASEFHRLPEPAHAGPRPSLHANRVLQGAILASVVLHVLALGWLPGLERMAERAPLPLRILLLAPADSRPVVLPPPAVTPAPTPATRQAAASPAPLHRSSPDTPAPAPALRAEEPVSAALPAPAVPVPAPSAVAQPAVQPAAAPDFQALAGYGRSVAGALAGHQRYPRIAQMRQWQGTTMLQLEFAADGRLLETRVLSSSGHEILDRQALEMLHAAQPLPPPPAALAGRPLVVNVPVVFRLAG